MQDSLAPPTVRLVADDGEAALRDAQMVCGTCARHLSKYSCPRCNGRTCSLACYQQHSRRCTEAFARESTEQALRGACTAHTRPLARAQASPRAGLNVQAEQRQSVLDILQRAHAANETDAALANGAAESEEEEEEEEEEGEPAAGLSAETLSRLLESEEPRLEQLSESEQRLFLRAACSGQLRCVISSPAGCFRP